jgi:hypothetical protein
MSPHARAVVIWAPRWFGAALGGFVALFALDAFGGRPFLTTLPEFIVHLIPAMVVAAIVAVGWRFPWIGAAAAAALAITYAAMVPTRRDWVLVISGPLVLLAGLFALSAVAKSGTVPKSSVPR